MMKNKTLSIELIRLANLQTLVSEVGSLVDVASKSDTSAAYLSQIITRSKMSNGKVRDVGSKLARKLEKGCKKPSGWMDVAHDVGDPLETELRAIFASMNSDKQELLLAHAKLIRNT